jgi:V-type H+-transporting ATPase subunit C
VLCLHQSVVLAPSTKSEKKVRSILEGLCGNANRYIPCLGRSLFGLLVAACSSFWLSEHLNYSSYWRSEDDAGIAAGLGGETESHPYVSFTINFV